MSQPDIDVQLKVWKDLAVSKQMLMGAATDALGLDAECSSAELKEALEKAIKRAREADSNITQTREKADKEIAEMMEVSEGTSKSQFARARKLLQEKIAEEEKFERYERFK